MPKEFKVVVTETSFNMETRIDGRLVTTSHFSTLSLATDSYEKASIIEMFYTAPSPPTNADMFALGRSMRDRFPKQQDWIIEMWSQMFPNDQ